MTASVRRPRAGLAPSKSATECIVYWLMLLTFATAFVVCSSLMALACPHLISILSFSVCLMIVSSRC